MAFHPPAATPPGLWRRTPPAIFPAIMGLFGLGLAWRRAGDVFEAPGGPSEMILGAVMLLFLFSVLAYGVKLMRRPKVVLEDLRTLPGRAGVAAGVVCFYLLSLTLLPYDGNAAWQVLCVGLALHVLFIAVFVYVLIQGSAPQRRVTPVWHLGFAGIIIAALVAVGLQHYGMALVLFGLAAVVSAFIWAVSLEQMVREDVPGPLRPLLAIHVAPVALFGLVAAGLELDAIAMGAAGVAALIVVWLFARVRWLTESGYSALWAAFTFPLAATATLWLTLGGFWIWPGLLGLLLSTIIIPPIAWKVLRAWAGGQLALKTNAAIA